MTVWNKTKSWRVTSGWNCKALQQVQNAQWPSERCNYFMTIQPKTKSCIFTCGCNCKALLLRMHSDSDRQLSMTIWPQIKSCSCECKALMLFRIQWPKETAMMVRPETVVELPVTVRPWHCSECTVTKRDSYDSTVRDSHRVTCDCKASMLFRMQRPKETGMTAWPKTKSCRVTYDFKALTFFRMHSDQKRQLWQYGPRQRVVELPVTVRPRCCSECKDQKRQRP